MLGQEAYWHGRKKKTNHKKMAYTTTVIYRRLLLYRWEIIYASMQHNCVNKVLQGSQQNVEIFEEAG